MLETDPLRVAARKLGATLHVLESFESLLRQGAFFMTLLADRHSALNEVDELRRQVEALRQKILGNEAVPTELLEGNARVLLLRVGTECMAFLQDYIQEVVMMCRLAAVPEGPPWLAGMLNLRGTAVPVLDVLARLSRRQRRPEITDFIVVCRIADRVVGLLVQEIIDVYEAPREVIQPACSDLEAAPYLIGVFYRQDQTVLLLSLRRLLAVSELAFDT